MRPSATGNLTKLERVEPHQSRSPFVNQSGTSKNREPQNTTCECSERWTGSLRSPFDGGANRCGLETMSTRFNCRLRRFMKRTSRTKVLCRSVARPCH